jgi:membrane fusion protein (multidrug efflux system)
MKRLLALFTLLGMALVMGAGCHSSEADPATPPRQQHVLVGQPQVGTIENTITLPGDIVGYYQSTLYAKVTGYLKSISVDKGDWVKAGQTLAVIEVPELQQRLDRSQANLQIARLTYQRMENVWRSDPRLVARQDVDISLAKYQEAKAEDDELHALFSYTRITAPFDGMITARYVDPGALIHAGGHQNGMSQAERTGDAAGPVVSLARLDKLRIYVYLPQNEVDFVHTGLPVTVAVQGETARYRGAVARFAHSLDLSTRTMLTEVDLENPNHSLYPGMYANVTLVLERHPNALRLPQSAVGGTKSHRVFIVRNGQLAEIPVQTGISDGRNIEIVSGLTRKDLVVQDFSASLQSGEQVNYSVVHDASEVASAREADPNASTITR